MKLSFLLTFVCCIVACLSAKYEQKCYALLFCDGGSASKSDFEEQVLSKPLNSSDIEYSGCSKRQIEVKVDGWKKVLKADNVYVKGETYKNLKRVEGWIFRCDDNVDEKKGSVKVVDKSCDTDINAMLFEVCWNVKKD